MTTEVKLLVTLGIFIIPFLFLPRLIIMPKLNRVRFSLLSTSLVGVQLFTISILFVDYKPLTIGLIMLLLAVPGTFPTFYILYPNLKSFIEERITAHNKSNK